MNCANYKLVKYPAAIRGTQANNEGTLLCRTILLNAAALHGHREFANALTDTLPILRRCLLTMKLWIPSSTCHLSKSYGCEPDLFSEDLRLFFQDRFEFAKKMMERDHQRSGGWLKRYLLSKAKIAVIDLMLSDDIQRTIRVASEKD